MIVDVKLRFGSDVIYTKMRIEIIPNTGDFINTELLSHRELTNRVNFHISIKTFFYNDDMSEIDYIELELE